MKQTIKLDRVDYNTIIIDGIDMKDYPDFVDAYPDSAQYFDGTYLTEDELYILKELVPDVIQQLALEQIQ